MCIIIWEFFLKWKLKKISDFFLNNSTGQSLSRYSSNKMWLTKNLLRLVTLWNEAKKSRPYILALRTISFFYFDIQCKIQKMFHILLFPHSKIFILLEKLCWKHIFSLKLENLLLLFSRFLILKCSYIIKFNFQNKEIGQVNKMLISVFVFMYLKSNLKCAKMGRRFQNMKVTKSSEISYTSS